MVSIACRRNGSGGSFATFQQLLREAHGLSLVTAWRYRKRGWLPTLNICGRVDITEAAAMEFLHRAQAGDFARDRLPFGILGSQARVEAVVAGPEAADGLLPAV